MFTIFTIFQIIYNMNLDYFFLFGLYIEFDTLKNKVKELWVNYSEQIHYIFLEYKAETKTLFA